MTIAEVLTFVSKVDTVYEVEDYRDEQRASDRMQHVQTRLSAFENGALIQAPIPWRNEVAAVCMINFMELLAEDVYVDVERGLSEAGMMKHLKRAKALMKKSAQGERIHFDELQEAATHLYDLEMMHKCLVAYMWLSWRLPAAFADRDRARSIKAETEKAIWWLIQQASKKELSVVPVYSRSKGSWDNKNKKSEFGGTNERRRPGGSGGYNRERGKTQAPSSNDNFGLRRSTIVKPSKGDVWRSIPS